MPSRSIYRELLELFLAVSRRLDAITLRLAPPLAISESHLLTAVMNCEGEAPTAQQLCRTLRVDKSAASRLINDLVARRFLSAEPDPRDRRARHLAVTSQGREALAQDGRIRNNQVSEFAQRLSTRAQSELVLLLRQMADNLGAPSLSSAGDEHPLKEQIRRLTRAFGFLNNDIFFSGVALEECQVLVMLSGEQGGLPLGQVVDALPYERTRLSRLITALEQTGYLRRAQSTTDRRQYVLHLTPAGIERLETVEVKASELFDRAFTSFSETQLDSLRMLLRTTVDVEIEGVVNTIGPGSGIALVKTERERKLARGFLLEQLVHKGQHFDAPESFVSQKGRTFVLYRMNSIAALIEFQPLGTRWQAVQFVELPNAVSDAEIWTFISEAFRELFSMIGGESVEISASPLAERLRTDASPLRDAGNSLEITAESIERFRDRLSKLLPDA